MLPLLTTAPETIESAAVTYFACMHRCPLQHPLVVSHYTKLRNSAQQSAVAAPQHSAPHAPRAVPVPPPIQLLQLQSVSNEKPKGNSTKTLVNRYVRVVKNICSP